MTPMIMSALLAALLLALQVLTGPTVAAQVPSQEVAVTRAPAIPRRVPMPGAPTEDVQITAASAAVLDAASGVVLWGKRPYAVRPLASITKLLTALTVVRGGRDGAARIVMLPEDIPPEGNTVFRSGDVVREDDLLSAMLVRSDNGAARALARRQGADVMRGAAQQRVARALALPSVRVADPAGLHADNAANAVDAARILLAAMREPVIAQRLAIAEMSIPVHRPTAAQPLTIRSTNLLLHDDRAATLGFVGGKTGYLDESGYNFVAAFERDGRRIAVAILGAASDADRFRDAETLTEWVFESYEW